MMEDYYIDNNRMIRVTMKMTCITQKFSRLLSGLIVITINQMKLRPMILIRKRNRFSNIFLMHNNKRPFISSNKTHINSNKKMRKKARARYLTKNTNKMISNTKF